MKANTSRIFLFLLLSFQIQTFAQMGINSTGTPPATNAMLDISSTTKGLLIPRMTTAQRSVLSHAQGLTVFDITTNSYWYSNGSAWVNMATISSASPWLTTGNDIYNSNTGNVGIGTSNPSDKLSIISALPGYGITHSFGPVTMGTFISNLYGQFGTKTNHPLQFFTNNGNAQMTLLPVGNVGIGTTNPTYKLDIVANVNVITGLRVKNNSNSVIDIESQIGESQLRFNHNGNYKWALSNNSTTDNLEILSNIGKPKIIIENGTGNIGFNTGAPQSNLHIDPSGAGSILIGTDKNTGGFTNLEMGISAQSGGQSYIQSTKASGSLYGTLQLNPSGGDVTVAGYVGIGTNTPFSPLDIVASGNVLQSIRILMPGHIWGIGISGGDHLNFIHNGQSRAIIDNTDGSYRSYSDKRLKKNIEEMSSVLDKVLQLKAKSYQFIDSPESTKKSTGFISQEVVSLFPELVSSSKRSAEDSTSYLSLNYAGFSVIAIKAIQEQQKIINDLRARLEALEKKLK
jgi:trimeric autotransporter adhesin